ncbi:hypothetical protein AAZX31_18G016100 [Glycine max]
MQSHTYIFSLTPIRNKGNMSIEAMAMAGMDYKECAITLEECYPQQQPPMYLVAEPNNELVNVAAVEMMKAKIREWAKAVASTSKQQIIADEKCKVHVVS